MKCGVAMLSDALSWFKKVRLEAGYVVVLETAGRAGHWNPHLHIVMTSIAQTIATYPEAPWIFIVDQLNIHQSETFVRLVARACRIEEDWGEKEKRGV